MFLSVNFYRVDNLELISQIRKDPYMAVTKYISRVYAAQSEKHVIPNGWKMLINFSLTLNQP